METLKTNNNFLNRWKAFSSKNIYAKNIEFKDIIDNEIKILKNI